MLGCHRCDAEIESVDFWQSGWITVHVWDDGATVNVCPHCQRPDESEIAERLNEADA